MPSLSNWAEISDFHAHSASLSIRHYSIGKAAACFTTLTITTEDSTSRAFSQRLRKKNLNHPLGSVGDAFDNAVVEALWARLQTELLNTRKWKTRTELSTAIFDWIEIFYNRTRRHSTLGNISPAEFDRRRQQQPHAA